MVAHVKLPGLIFVKEADSLKNSHICSDCPSPPLCVSSSPDCSRRSCGASHWPCVSFRTGIPSYSAKRKTKHTLLAFRRPLRKRAACHSVAHCADPEHACTQRGMLQTLKMQLWASSKQYPDTGQAQSHTHTSLSLARQENGPLSELKGVGLVFWAGLPPPHNWTTNSLTGT